MGGGSAIFVKDGMDFKVIDVSEFCIESIFEVTAVILPGANFVIVSLYRTPDSNINIFLNSLETFLLFLHKKYKGSNISLASDFNIDTSKKSSKADSLLNLLRSFNLYCLNREVTRENACLDNIASNISRENVTCTVVEPHLSDHAGVLAKFYVSDYNQGCKNEVKTIRNISTSAMLNFRKRLQITDWTKLIRILDAEQACDYFIDILTISFNECCILREQKINTQKRPKIKWFTPKLKRVKEFVLTLYDRFRNSKGTPNESKYKKEYLTAKKVYQYKIRQEKISQNESYIKNSSNKCKAAWNVIKSEANSISKCNQLSVIDSNTFNDYFVNLVSSLESNSSFNKNVPVNRAIDLVNSYTLSCDKGCDNFVWQKIKGVDVLKFVSNLSSSRSEDYYGFSNKVVKDVIDLILEPLTFIFNKILEQGKYPRAFKLTKVTPIFKKGEKLSPSSYRPISLIPIFSKILEGCITQQLNEFFIKNNLLCDNQFGFISGRSTTQAIEKIVEQILLNFENRLTSSAILIDLTKAFDCISHELIIKKLSCYGLKSNELSLFNSYLNDRRQMVVQRQDKSELKTLKVGVPQGSVLGPFLFVVAINDLAFNVPCTTVLYADDTTLLNFDKNLEQLVKVEEQALKVALQWFEANRLIVNSRKTEHIMFSLDHTINKDIKPVKLLGMYLDSRLSWDYHVGELCKKLSRVTYLLRKLRNCVTIDMLVTAYYAFFESHLRYGLTLWGNSCGWKKAFIWQKKALRVMTKVPERETCRPIFMTLQIMTLPSLYIYCCLVSVKKILSSLKVRQEMHNYPTRQNHLLDLPAVRLEKTYSSHIIMKFKLFNKLPGRAWIVPLHRFKIVLGRWLKENTFYSVEEFMAFDTSTLSF